MEKDVVYDENELSIAVNDILNYADFLSRCIEEYVGLLHELQNTGIQDKLICSEMKALVMAVEPYKTAIYDVGESMTANINKSMGEIETADNFRFPNDIISAVSALFTNFL